MKKLLTFATSLLLVMSMFSGCAKNNETETTTTSAQTTTTQSAETTEAQQETETTVAEGTQEEQTTTAAEEINTSNLKTQAEVLANAFTGTPTGSVTRGTTSGPDEYFFGSWSNNATNYETQRLIGLLDGGYDTISWVKEGAFEVNPVVVKNIDIAMNDDGSKTFTIEIYDNLVYNDGSAITAKDFVFYGLWNNCPQYGELDGDNFVGSDVVGYDEFHDGTVNYFSGLRLLNDYTYSITVKAESLPYYYDITFAGLSPLPYKVFVPDGDIKDDGQGAYVDGTFTVDVLRETVMDPQTGYAFNPQVTPGPYSLVSYNPNDQSIVLEANTNFLGTYEGARPRIEKIYIKTVTQATSFDEFRAGTVDLLDGILAGDEIETGLDIVEASTNGEYDYIEYPRAGYGKIQFRCDFSPTQFAAVRQAIAYCLDRDEFCKQFTLGYGIVVDGYYGASMKEYQDNKDILDENLNHYAFNLDKAKEVLIADGWVLNKDGGDYDENGSDVRYKMLDDGTLMPLIIEWNSSENNAVSELISAMLPIEAAKVGMKINQTITDFATLRKNTVETNDPKFSMFNLATTFSEINAVWFYYGDNPEYFGPYNSNFIVDKQLSDTAWAMKATDSSDYDTWSSLWVDLQIRWNELLPEVPLYSNQLHDFFSSKLVDYDNNPTWDWSRAIVRAAVQ